MQVQILNTGSEFNSSVGYYQSKLLMSSGADFSLEGFTMYTVKDDGTKVENSKKLTGSMTEVQRNYFAHNFAGRAMDIAERRGYGIGEVGYYIKEDCLTLIELNLATESEASDIMHRAEDKMCAADELGATLEERYSERLENTRMVE